MLGGEDLALGVDDREPPGDRPPLRVAGLLAGQTDDNLTEREARTEAGRKLVALRRGVLRADDLQDETGVGRRRFGLSTSSLAESPCGWSAQS